jgi:CheY-like chemotaxis protein
MAPRKILVVDDEKNQREILQLILGGERDETGTQLYEYPDRWLWAEATATASAGERIDLVLTDLKMTGMDGIRAAQ